MGTRNEGAERAAVAGSGTDETFGCEAQFMRGRTDGDSGEVELRFWCPRSLVNVLDAVVMARGGQSANIHRGTVLSEVLGEWGEKKRHEASLIHRVAGLNPTGSERMVQELRVAGDVK